MSVSRAASSREGSLVLPDDRRIESRHIWSLSKLCYQDPLSICGVIERCHPLKPNLGPPTLLLPTTTAYQWAVFDTCSVSHGKNPMWKEAQGILEGAQLGCRWAPGMALTP